MDPIMGLARSLYVKVIEDNTECFLENIKQIMAL